MDSGYQADAVAIYCSLQLMHLSYVNVTVFGKISSTKNDISHGPSLIKQKKKNVSFLVNKKNWV